MKRSGRTDGRTGDRRETRAKAIDLSEGAVPASNPSGLPSDLSDEEIVRRVAHAGETGLFELLMRRHNQRVYRLARAILPDGASAEDLAQEAWVRVFEHLAQFSGAARFSTWLTRIVLYEGWSRSRKARHLDEVTAGMDETSEELVNASPDPESRTLSGEVRGLLESALDSLAEPYRVVLVMRDVEGFSTAETAEALVLTPNAVKVRLHRARAMVRRYLTARVGPGVRKAFPFLGECCDRMVAAVLARLKETGSIEAR